MMCSITEAKANLNKLASSSETVILSKKGKAIAALIPYEQFRAMKRLLKAQHEQEALRRGKAFLAGDVSEFEKFHKLQRDP